MKNWHLLYCKRGQIARAIEHLERQQVICFTPMVTIEKLIRNKRTLVTEPLFPNYLFIQFDPEVIHTTTINSTRGVNAFVRFGRYPVTVPQEVIDTLQSPTPGNIEEALNKAVMFSGLSVTGKGTQSSYPSIEEFSEFLSSAK